MGSTAGRTSQVIPPWEVREPRGPGLYPRATIPLQLYSPCLPLCSQRVRFAIESPADGLPGEGPSLGGGGVEPLLHPGLKLDAMESSHSCSVPHCSEVVANNPSPPRSTNNRSEEPQAFPTTYCLCELGGAASRKGDYGRGGEGRGGAIQMMYPESSTSAGDGLVPVGSSVESNLEWPRCVLTGRRWAGRGDQLPALLNGRGSP